MKQSATKNKKSPNKSPTTSVKAPKLKLLEEEKDYFDYNDFLFSFIPDNKNQYVRDKNSKMKYQLEVI